LLSESAGEVEGTSYDMPVQVISGARSGKHIQVLNSISLVIATVGARGSAGVGKSN